MGVGTYTGYKKVLHVIYREKESPSVLETDFFF